MRITRVFSARIARMTHDRARRAALIATACTLSFGCTSAAVRVPPARAPIASQPAREWIDEQPSRDAVLRSLTPFDEFVRRCTRGPHRVFALATITFQSDGSAVMASIDTGDSAADDCVARLLSLAHIERFRQPVFTVAFPMRVYSEKPTRVRVDALASEPDLEFAPELCLWGAADDPACRDEREARAVDCPHAAR